MVDIIACSAGLNALILGYRARGDGDVEEHGDGAGDTDDVKGGYAASTSASSCSDSESDGSGSVAPDRGEGLLVESSSIVLCLFDGSTSERR